MKICSIEGCGKKHFGNGFCCMHNARMRKYGDPLVVKTSSPGDGLKFVHDVVLQYEGDECLIWPFGRFKDGCGAIQTNGKKQRVPRVVCEIVNGPAPNGAKSDAAHSCGNGHLGCVTKRHLRWATRKENVGDAIAHGTNAKGVKNGRAKLTERDVIEIRKARGCETQEVLGRRFGVSPSLISGVQSGELWKHVGMKA